MILSCPLSILTGQRIARWVEKLCLCEHGIWPVTTESCQPLENSWFLLNLNCENQCNQAKLKILKLCGRGHMEREQWLFKDLSWSQGHLNSKHSFHPDCLGCSLVTPWTIFPLAHLQDSHKRLWGTGTVWICEVLQTSEQTMKAPGWYVLESEVMVSNHCWILKKLQRKYVCVYIYTPSDQIKQKLL